MKATLVCSDGRIHTVEVARADEVGVILRSDSRLSPPVRAFKFSALPVYDKQEKRLPRPVFEEVACVDIGGEVDF